MPHGVREVGALFPLRWYQIALRRIVERGAGLAEVAGPILALFILFGVDPGGHPLADEAAAWLEAVSSDQ